MKRIILLGMLCIIVLQSSACEICGCGVGNFYLGLLPHFNSKFFGVRYQYMQYHTQLANDATQYSNDYYKSIELWSGININSRLQLIVFVPYNINKQITDDGIKNNQGLGDVTALLNYNVLQNRSSNGNRSIQQQLWIGGGVKLPTGKNTIDVNDPLVNPGDVNSQTGTGSTDFLANASYDISINKIGLNTSVNYKMNTANNTGYRFGNRLAINSFAYYRLRAAGIGFSPNVGMLYQNASANSVSKIAVDQTGGNILSAAGGIEMNYKFIAVGANVQLPVSQNLSEKQTQLKLKGMVHVTFAF